MSELAILGSGLVTPFGLTPREHAFFLPALLPPPAGSPFLGPKDKPVAIERAAFLDVTAGTGARMTTLALHAARSALGDFAEAGVQLGLLLVTDTRRPGLDDADVMLVEDALRRLVKPVFVEHVRGQAGPFGALAAAVERAHREHADGLLVVSVDSLISIDYLAHHVTHGPTHWMTWPPVPSEGAAALLVTHASPRAKWGVSALGWLGKAAALRGASSDEDDEIVDGTALTEVVREVAGARVHYVFGQGSCGNLRIREWLLAMGRTAERFRAGHDEADLEPHVGSLGAAAGLANAVYGLAALRHRTLPYAWPREPALLAWHITRDGVRGGASLRIGDGS